MTDPFTIKTGDPRFNAGEPVVINGHSYVAAREVEALQARCAELEAGLKPFAAEYSDAGADRLADEMLWEKANPAGGMIVTVGDFRRALTTYRNMKGQSDGE